MQDDYLSSVMQLRAVLYLESLVPVDALFPVTVE